MRAGPFRTPTYLRSIHLSAASSLSEEKGHQPRNIRFFHGTHFHAKTAGLSLSGENSYFIIKAAECNPTNIWILLTHTEKELMQSNATLILNYCNSFTSPAPGRCPSPHCESLYTHTKSIHSSREYKSILCDVDKKQDSHSLLTYLFFKNKSMARGFGTWIQNNGLMRQRLSSLSTLIFIGSRKSDTREDSLTFSHIRFLLLNTITVRQWLN